MPFLKDPAGTFNPLGVVESDLSEKETSVFLEGESTSRKKFKDKNNGPEIGIQIWHSIVNLFASIGWFFGDILRELWDSLKAIFYFVTCQKDPIREISGIEIQLWLCLKRASYQVYRTAGSFLFEQVLHLGCGMFISIAVQKMTALGTIPLDICISTPYVMRWRCYDPENTLREAGMFVAIGAMFAGINISSGTFGKEKVVYWRERATGLKSLPYFLAKLIVDIPRVILAAGMYSVALTLFFPYRQIFILLYVSVLLVYINAFAIGYTISIVFENAIVPLLGTGLSLLWALVLSGVIPELSTVTDATMVWLWNISGPRWFVESFWVSEMSRRPWVDFTSKADGEVVRYTYVKGHYSNDALILIYISITWLFLAFLMLKLMHRRQQK
ncbi:hypothetical protein HK096_005070 [Nowakowskiella sp. JEL0078]|nr:hypothetical protein HK096_005070 [Nowakowskiella sp. JEL0078]